MTLKQPIYKSIVAVFIASALVAFFTHGILSTALNAKEFNISELPNIGNRNYNWPVVNEDVFHYLLAFYAFKLTSNNDSEFFEELKLNKDYFLAAGNKVLANHFAIQRGEKDKLARENHPSLMFNAEETKFYDRYKDVMKMLLTKSGIW
jgi:hypothetical protein